MGNPENVLIDPLGQPLTEREPTPAEMFRARINWLEKRSGLLDAMVSGIDGMMATNDPMLGAVLAEFVGDAYLEARAMKGV